MPLLKPEPFVFPPDLLQGSDGQVPGEGRWWVLHAKPRSEKALARKLLPLQQAFFLPLYKKQWRSGGRLQTSFLPLFPGYLFLRGDEATRLAALQTNLLVRILEVPIAEADTLSGDLQKIYRLMELGSALSPEERLQPGTAVVITAGPLAGFEGVVIRRDNQVRFLVQVNFIQQGASVEVEGWMLQPL